jgi:hypothetical protein
MLFCGTYASISCSVASSFPALEQSPRLPQKQESLQREVVRVDKEIDKRVYILYGLMEEEIKMVDGN